MPYPLRQEYLFSYDVEDNRIRTRIFKELSKHGLKSVQKSVFWGYLNLAELKAVKRYLKSCLEKRDKLFITHSNFNGKGESYFIGHCQGDFRDWEENHVI